MNPADQLESEFEAIGNKRHGILLLTASQSLDMIEQAEKRGIEILGIDSFILKGNTIQPIMEESIDFSILKHAIDGHWKESSAFIDHRKERDFLFEVVLGNKRATEQDAAANP